MKQSAGPRIVPPSFAWRLVAGLAVAWTGAARALDPDVPLDQLQQLAWSRAEGAPTSLHAVAQTADGFIWGASNSGLTRFDGVKFDRVSLDSDTPLPPGGFHGLFADGAEGLWALGTGGTVVHVRGRQASVLPKLPASGRAQAVRWDQERRVWVIARGGIFELRDGAWRPHAVGEGLEGSRFDDLAFDANGAAWALTDAGIFVRPRGAARFELASPRRTNTAPSGLEPAQGDGVWMWATQGEHNLCHVRISQPIACWQAPGILDPLLDAHGSLWWSTAGGVNRVRHPERLRRDDPSDLERQRESREGPTVLHFAAQDGSLWGVAINRSLTQLRQPTMRRARTPHGGIVAGERGGLFVASFSRGLMRIGAPPPGTRLMVGPDGTLWTEQAAAQIDGIRHLMSFKPFEGRLRPDDPVVLERYAQIAGAPVRLDRDRAGVVYVGTLSPPGLTRLVDGHAQSIALPPLAPGDLVRGAQTDARGRLWLAADAVVSRRDEGQWLTQAGLVGVNAAKASGLMIDAHDRLWVPLGHDGIGMLEGERWRQFGRGDGLESGAVRVVYARDGHVWAGGEGNAAMLVGDRFAPLLGFGDQPFGECSGFAQTEVGDLWLNCGEGVFRIERREWQRAVTPSGHRVAFTRFDDADGIQGSAAATSPQPAMALGGDGRLWFVTTKGLYWLDPTHLPAPRPAPKVVPSAVFADEQRHVAEPGLELPQGTQRVRLEFLAPGAEAPARTRFRYRLQGVDAGWVDAGTRRELSYSQLDPGDHRLEIVASDRDGRFGDVPTVFDFRVRPAFHQTAWFRALVAIAALALLALAWAWRLRLATERVRREMGARFQERLRIARDLHDTLLQGVQGLVLQFDAVKRRTAPEDPLRASMEAALVRAEETLNEGRDRLVLMREPLAGGGSDLARALARHAAPLAKAHGVTFETIVAQSPRPLRPLVHEEMFGIGREALTNAISHAGAARVTLELMYSNTGLQLAVVDDGRGIPAGFLAADGREGHWGLQGMRERAGMIGASLEISNRAEGGTSVVARIAAERAYERNTRSFANDRNQMKQTF